MKPQILLKSLPRRYSARWRYCIFTFDLQSGPRLYTESHWQLEVSDYLNGLIWESEWRLSQRYTWYPVGWQL